MCVWVRVGRECAVCACQGEGSNLPWCVDHAEAERHSVVPGGAMQAIGDAPQCLLPACKARYAPKGPWSKLPRCVSLHTAPGPAKCMDDCEC